MLVGVKTVYIRLVPRSVPHVYTHSSPVFAEEKEACFAFPMTEKYKR